MTPSTPGSGPVWAKRVSDRAGQANVAYCAGRDVVARPPADSLLLDADLWTNRAHAVMLAKQGILSKSEAAAVLRALQDIHTRAKRGDFPIPPDCEDVHMAVEAEVTRLAGPGAGGRLHTGRSRNDQTTTDIRIWTRDALLGLLDDLSVLIAVLLDHAAAHLDTVCPGFTHMQPAMATTWGHVVAAWAQGLLRDVERLESACAAVNRCPLGAAASFGTSWPIDRELTARLLGFVDDKGKPIVQQNTLDCISSRGEPETQAVFALATLMNRLSGIGQDLILLSTPPRAWIRIDDRFVTGSSIMPQKRNPDFAEVTRAKAAVLAGMVASLLGIGRAAPAGYNRDTQWTKYLVLDAFAEIESAAPVFAGVFKTLRVDKNHMRDACREGFMNAAEIAEAVAAESSLPFRACYRVVAEAVARCEKKGQLDRETLNAILKERWKDITESAKNNLTPENSECTEKKGRTTKSTKDTKREKTRSVASGAASAKAGRGAMVPYQISAALWETLDDPMGLIRRRNQTGSPAPQKMKSLLRSLQSDLLAARKAIDAHRIALDTARKTLALHIQKLEFK